MKRYNNKYTPSNQHPSYFIKHKYLESIYSYMLLEDFSMNFSIEFTHDRDSEKFYKVEPADDKLKEYLTFEDYSFFRYDMDKILQNIMYSLLIDGRTYLEIVLWADAAGHIAGISLEPFSAIPVLKLRDKYTFCAQTHDQKCRCFSMLKRNVISFDLKDLGFPRNYFRRLFRRMKPFETSLYSMSKNRQFQNVDFDAHIKKRDFHFLKLTKRIGWLGRNYSNPNLSEAYLLHRTIRYKTLKKRFLDYFLAQINQGLEAFQDDLEFHGKIVIPEFDTEHATDWAKMQRGEMGYSAISNLIH